MTGKRSLVSSYGGSLLWVGMPGIIAVFTASSEYLHVISARSQGMPHRGTGRGSSSSKSLASSKEVEDGLAGMRR